jgi:hypothetical protein
VSDTNTSGASISWNNCGSDRSDKCSEDDNETHFDGYEGGKTVMKIWFAVGRRLRKSDSLNREGKSKTRRYPLCHLALSVTVRCEIDRF